MNYDNGLNMLVVWNYDINNKAFKDMLSVLNVKTCHYVYVDKNEIKEDGKSKYIYLYSGLDYYKNIKAEYELDDAIMSRYAK